MGIGEASFEAESAMEYLRELGGVEWSGFPEEFAYIHDGGGAVATPVAMAKAVRPDGGIAAVAFIEERYGKPAEPGTGWGGVAVVHDEPRLPRAFTFSNIEEFDEAVGLDFPDLLRE